MWWRNWEVKSFFKLLRENCFRRKDTVLQPQFDFISPPITNVYLFTLQSEHFFLPLHVNDFGLCIASMRCFFSPSLKCIWLHYVLGYFYSGLWGRAGFVWYAHIFLCMCEASVCASLSLSLPLAASQCLLFMSGKWVFLYPYIISFWKVETRARARVRV